MSSERPSKRSRIARTAGFLDENLPSLHHLSRPPTPSLINVDPTSDMTTTDVGTRCVTEALFPYVLSITDFLVPSSKLLSEIVPVFGLYHAPATAVASTEAHGMSPPSSVLVSASIPSAPRELGSVSSPAPETVSAHLAPTIDVANHALFSSWPRTPTIQCLSSRVLRMHT